MAIVINHDRKPTPDFPPVSLQVQLVSELITKTKRFLVVGHPRSGSTFLIERLVRAADADAPLVNHKELFNLYERLFNTCVLQLDGSTELGMLRSFFARSTKQFAGLKTIPSFHREWASVAAVPDLQFITISRKDVLSSIASILVSENTRIWDRTAREQLDGRPGNFGHWFRDRREQEMVLGDLINRFLFDTRSIEQLNARPTTIALTCEELVGDTFRSEQLDEFFGQRMSLRGFRQPTDYRECFEDAPLFHTTIIQFLRSVLQSESFVPACVQELIAAN